MAISPVKFAKKGKRHPEESIEKQSAAKKLKREVEEAVEKQKNGKKSKASFKVAPKKKLETSYSEDVSSSELEKEASVARGPPNRAVESYRRRLERVEFKEEEYYSRLELLDAGFILLTVDQLISMMSRENDLTTA